MHQPSLRATLFASCLLLVFSASCGSPLKYTKPGVAMGVVATSKAGGMPQVGAQIPVLLNQDISSRSVAGKEPVVSTHQAFVVAYDVRDPAGAVVIKEGTPVAAEVTRRQHRRIGREGYVRVAFKSTTAANGQAVRLDDSPQSFKGQRRFPGAIAGTVFLGPLFLLRTGGDIAVEAGSGLTATVAP